MLSQNQPSRTLSNGRWDTRELRWMRGDVRCRIHLRRGRYTQIGSTRALSDTTCVLPAFTAKRALDRKKISPYFPVPVVKEQLGPSPEGDEFENPATAPVGARPIPILHSETGRLPGAQQVRDRSGRVFLPPLAPLGKAIDLSA